MFVMQTVDHLIINLFKSELIILFGTLIPFFLVVIWITSKQIQSTAIYSAIVEV